LTVFIRIDFNNEFTSLNSKFNNIIKNAILLLDIGASGLEFTRYYGYGNEIPYDENLADINFYKLEQRLFSIRPKIEFKLSQSVNRDQTGSLMGVNNSLGSIGQITTPIMGGAIIEYLDAWILPILSASIFAFMQLFWYVENVQIWTGDITAA